MSDKKLSTNRVLLALTVVLGVVLGACWCGWSVIRAVPARIARRPTAEPVMETSLAVAYSPEKEETFTRLVSAFNEQVASSSDERSMAWFLMSSGVGR